MPLYTATLAALIVAIVAVTTTSGDEDGTTLANGAGDAELGSVNVTSLKVTDTDEVQVTGEPPYEANWVITDQPRCCSDCTFVAAGFKCKVKSCLHNCPWARSAAPERAVPVF
ncbi:uncharacterized protein [Periplaneta americana]|uniref:uncharacterized protein isoform X2 n=1 Tax=Periplaneta americana TaxID=6978 RepID=UPI0037E9B126